jgi:hypothetical protein
MTISPHVYEYLFIYIVAMIIHVSDIALVILSLFFNFVILPLCFKNVAVVPRLS